MLNGLIILFGILIVLGGVAILVKPYMIFGLIGRHSKSAGLQWLAVLVRVAMGTVLILGAPDSRYPLVLQVLGWITIAAALVLGVMGRERFRRLIEWVIEFAPAFRSLAGVLAVLLGAFLIHSVV